MIMDIDTAQKVFGSRVRGKLKELGMTCGDLAEKLGMSEDTIKSYLREEDPDIVPAYVAIKIAENLAVALNSLFGEDIERAVKNIGYLGADVILLQFYNMVTFNGVDYSVDGNKVSMSIDNRALALFLSILKKGKVRGVKNAIKLAREFRSFKVHENQVFDEIEYNYFVK